jgi:hypothetical protein
MRRNSSAHYLFPPFKPSISGGGAIDGNNDNVNNTSGRQPRVALVT